MNTFFKKTFKCKSYTLYFIHFGFPFWIFENSIHLACLVLSVKLGRTYPYVTPVFAQDQQLVTSSVVVLNLGSVLNPT